MEPRVLIERTVSNNKTDSIFPDNKHGTCMSIDAAISTDINMKNKKKRKF